MPVNKLLFTLKLIIAESVLKLKGGFKTCNTDILPILFEKTLSDISISSLFQPKSNNKGNCKFLKIVLLITTLLESIFLITIPTPSKFFLPKNSILFCTPLIVILPSHTIRPASIISILAPAATSKAPFTRITSLITCAPAAIFKLS